MIGGAERALFGLLDGWASAFDSFSVMRQRAPAPKFDQA